MLVNLLSDSVQNNKDKKARMVGQFTSNYVQTLQNNPMMSQTLDHVVNVNIKQRKLDDVLTSKQTMKLYLPTNFYLCLWLMISKRFKLKDLETGKNDEREDNIVKFKSSIMQSLYVSRKESASIETRNRVSLAFHKLLRNLERQA